MKFMKIEVTQTSMILKYLSMSINMCWQEKNLGRGEGHLRSDIFDIFAKNENIFCLHN